MRSVILIPLLLVLIFASESVSGIDSVEIRGAVAGTVNGMGNLVDNTFTWNPQNFAGFYFDLDKDLSTESLMLNLSSSKVEAGGVEYRTHPKTTPFEHKAWGNYMVLCFLGQKYFAGYHDDCQIAEAWSSLENGKILSEVLMDSDEKMTIASDEALPLKEGYSLRLSDADEGVKVLLYKRDNVIDSSVIIPPDDYIYEAPVGNTNTTLLAVGVKANVKSEPKSYYSIKGLFQISQKIITFNQSTKYGKMKVATSDNNGLVLKNAEDFNLTNESDLELMDGICLKSVNSEYSATSARRYLYENASSSDGNIIRGAVAGTIDGQSNLVDNSFIWTPQNFAGFYYDLKKDLGTENLKFVLSGDDGKMLSGDAPYGITYTTTTQQRRFKYGDWGHYNTIGFLGNSCFVSYADDSSLERDSKESALLVDSKLGIVLIDSGERQNIQNGGTLSLQDGFEAKLYIDKSCNKTLVELYKNGTLLDRNYLNVPGTYIYRNSPANGDDIAVLALHVAETTCTQGKSCVVDGIFQISEDLIDVNPNITFGKMTITGIDATTGEIVMNNRDNSITLRKNIVIPMMGDFHIKTADSDEPRFYIYKPTESL
jgi:S-layer protein (TIGR01567 family)